MTTAYLIVCGFLLVVGIVDFFVTRHLDKRLYDRLEREGD